MSKELDELIGVTLRVLQEAAISSNQISLKLQILAKQFEENYFKVISKQDKEEEVKNDVEGLRKEVKDKLPDELKDTT